MASSSLNPFRRLWRAVSIVVIAAALVACKEDLYSKLSERDANELLGALLAAQIDAAKSSPDGKAWTIAVEKSEVGRALSVLRAQGLPSQAHTNLGEMFKKDGLISTPTEERVRFIHGLSEELARTLSAIDGVIEARVHVVLPNNDPLAERSKPSSASVFIKHGASVNVVTLTPVIKNLVMRSIEGLTYENVNVTLFKAAAVGNALPSMPANQKAGGATLVAWLALAALFAAAGGTAITARLRPAWLPVPLRRLCMRYAPFLVRETPDADAGSSA